MNKKYICKCGKEFDKPNSFNGHKRHCKENLGEEKFSQLLQADSEKLKYAAQKLAEVRNNKKQNELEKWIEEKHVCEFCGIIMIQKYGSGRFCSRTCSKKFSNNLIKKNRNNISNKYCKVCNKKLKSTQLETCSIKCREELKYIEFIKNWQNGNLKNEKLEYLPKPIRRYMLEKSNYKCEECGWNKINPTTGNIPLQIHHKDNDPYNHEEKNLIVLCPNCHSLTESFGALNTGRGRKKNKWYTAD